MAFHLLLSVLQCTKWIRLHQPLIFLNNVHSNLLHVCYYTAIVRPIRTNKAKAQIVVA